MSIWHLLILLVILLLVFGPSRVEGIGVALGRAVGGFKKGVEEGARNDATTVEVSKKD